MSGGGGGVKGGGRGRGGEDQFGSNEAMKEIESKRTATRLHALENLILIMKRRSCHDILVSLRMDLIKYLEHQFNNILKNVFTKYEQLYM